MKKRTIVLPALLCTIALAASTDLSQSGSNTPNAQPIPGLEEIQQLETPEVVLQLKYDKGELNKIYLAQFRKGPSAWAPTVATRSSLCADLCHAGLGGQSCGSTCQDLTPVGLQSTLAAAVAHNASDDVVAGAPRVSVCPALCQNGLGEPLCGCEPGVVDHVEWGVVCDAFCLADRYVLGGCPVCADTPTTAASLSASRSARVLSTADGWVAWCSVQCRQGQGGAACNCDRSPFI